MPKAFLSHRVYVTLMMDDGHENVPFALLAGECWEPPAAGQAPDNGKGLLDARSHDVSWLRGTHISCGTAASMHLLRLASLRPHNSARIGVPVNVAGLLMGLKASAGR